MFCILCWSAKSKSVGKFKTYFLDFQTFGLNHSKKYMILDIPLQR